MRISIWYLLFSLVCLLSCDPPKAAKDVVEIAKDVAKSIDKPLLIYDTFEDIEYIFNYQNDTTYVINFWATWCKPCVKELPYFDDLYKEYEDKKVKIILVSLDFPKQIETKLVPFIKDNNVLPQVMVLKDGKVNDWGDKVSSKWDGAIPITLVYNRKERVFVSGEVSDYDELKSKVEPLILK